MIKSFNYNLTGTGWAEAFFLSETQNINFRISYLTDPLTDLVEGLYKLNINQSDEEKVIFADEPGNHSLVITRQDKAKIMVEIYWSDDWEQISVAHISRSEKALVYKDTETLKNFTTIICRGIDDLLERLTLKEYKENWHLFEFPTDSYKKLRQL